MAGCGLRRGDQAERPRVAVAHTLVVRGDRVRRSSARAAAMSCRYARRCSWVLLSPLGEFPPSRKKIASAATMAALMRLRRDGCFGDRGHEGCPSLWGVSDATMRGTDSVSPRMSLLLCVGQPVRRFLRRSGRRRFRPGPAACCGPRAATRSPDGCPRWIPSTCRACRPAACTCTSW